jgi:hypothetical protein
MNSANFTVRKKPIKTSQNVRFLLRITMIQQSLLALMAHKLYNTASKQLTARIPESNLKGSGTG